MSNRLFKILWAVVSLGVVFAVPSRAQDEWSWPEKPKNLQILNKDWPGVRLRPVMTGFTRALGVRCSYCHTGEEGKPLSTYDFASDQNPNKNRAREMLRMLGSVNDHLKKIEPSGDKRVNMWCHTCHRGRPRPMTLDEELAEQYRAKGLDSALNHYQDLKGKYLEKGTYDFSERSLNNFGYELLEKKDLTGAIRVFLLNAQVFPKSSNAWDSLAEAYVKAGDTKTAKRYYEKSLKLDPTNQGAKEMLRKFKEFPALGSTLAGGVLLVSYNAERQVAVIDTTTQKVLATFPSPQGPHEITVSRDGAKAFISDTGTGPGGDPGNSIVVVDLKNRVPQTTLQVCERPHDSRVSRDGRRLWVACAPMKAVQEIDAITGAVYKSWKTEIDGGWFLEITPDERKIYVPHLEGKALSVIDRKTGVARTLFSGTTQFGIAISPDGREVWVSDSDENKLSVVDTVSDKVLATVKLGSVEKGQPGFSRMHFSPDGRQVVVVLDSKFMVVDRRRRSISWSVNLPYPGKVVTVSGDSRRAFVSHPGHDRVSVIDLGNQRIEGAITVGKQPDGVAWAR